MPNQQKRNKDYALWLVELKIKIRESQLRAGLRVNTEMIALYWELGQSITEKQTQANWGDKIITQLAADLSAEFTDAGFSRSNLFNIRKFYQFYSQHPEIVQQNVGQLKDSMNSQIVQHNVGLFPTILGLVPWSHHIQLVSKCKTADEALFYLRETVKHNWKRSVLAYHIDSGYYYRKGKSVNNFDLTLPNAQSELAQEILKNPYNIGYLGLSGEVTERELEKALLTYLKDFLLELGTGFSFYGQQYHLRVGENDYYIDLLFYHTRLHCYVAVELKVTEFEPEHAGKLEFYITALDEQIKTSHDHPTIGLLLCKTADRIIVEYSLKTKIKPMGVAEYKHVVPEEWENALPKEEILKEVLTQEINIQQKPIQEKLQRLKTIVANLKTEPADIEKDNEIVRKVYTNIKNPLVELINQNLAELKPMFQNVWIASGLNNEWPGKLMRKDDLDERLVQNVNIWMLGIEVHLGNFIQGGTKAFSLWKRLEIHLDKHKYHIGADREHPWAEKVYRQFLSKEELHELSDRFLESLMDETIARIESIG